MSCVSKWLTSTARTKPVVSLAVFITRAVVHRYARFRADVCPSIRPLGHSVDLRSELLFQDNLDKQEIFRLVTGLSRVKRKPRATQTYVVRVNTGGARGGESMRGD
jgi:hypothetical protein